ncbi:MAG: ABC transporter transmembrane domain-containing protein [Robinsoniella sp.]|nr:ABC transporter transmembrane domain-containing protein [Robinsoniella sp.]
MISKYIIDAVAGYDSKGIIPAAVFYIMMHFLQIGSNAWTDRISEKVELKVDQEIRADVYDKIMEADWEAMSEFHSGDLLNRVDNDVSSVSSSVLGWAPDFVIRCLQFAGIRKNILNFLCGVRFIPDINKQFSCFIM